LKLGLEGVGTNHRKEVLGKDKAVRMRDKKVEDGNVLSAVNKIQ
jgi:hypothetical protein